MGFAASVYDLAKPITGITNLPKKQTQTNGTATIYK
jgi:hypothetical protein